MRPLASRKAENPRFFMITPRVSRTCSQLASCVLGFTLLVSLLRGQTPVISELMASNVNTLADEDGDFTDWIEIYHPGPSPYSVGGHFLTDDRRNLRKWSFPGNKSVPAHGYLVVHASGKNRTGLFAGTAHTNFQLSSDGEYLALIAPDGTTILSEFSPDYPNQRRDISFGIANNESGGTETRYFQEPTPGEANGEGLESLPPRVADTTFSHHRGFYDAPFEVTIATETEGATIYYSLDGSDPGKGSVFNPGTSYTGPITVDKTTMLRARAFKDGLEPTDIDTQTYIFTSSVIRQPAEIDGYPSSWENGAAADYEMDPDVVDHPAYRDKIEDALKDIPTLSIVTDRDNLFGADGIYLNVTRRPTQGEGADYRYEKEVSAEFIYPDGRNGIQLQCGLRAQGGASRLPDRSPKHALSLRFRTVYGLGRLRFPVIEESPQSSFNALHLRARYNNTWHHSDSGQQNRAQLIRDQFARDSIIAMGQEGGGHGNYHHLYLNGIYWGVYGVHERLDHSHYADYYGGQADTIDAVNGGSVTNGSLAKYNEMKDIVSSNNPDWDRIQQVLDIDDYIDWTIAERWLGNQDLKNDGNWKAAGGGPDNLPWRYFLWDTERILENVNFGTPTPVADPTGILDELSDIPQFVRRFGDRLHQHMFNGGALTTERNIARWMKRAEEIDLAIIAESARWGDYRRASNPYTRDEEWLSEQARLVNDYFPRRGRQALENFRGWGLYPNVDGVDFSQFGGRVDPGFMLTLSSEAISIFQPGTIHYTTNGEDPQLDNGDLNPNAVAYGGPFELSESSPVKARVQTPNGWSALSHAFFTVGAAPASADNLVISEIMYHPAPPTAEESAAGHVSSDWFEFIELQNISSEAIDLAGLAFTDGISFGFPDGADGVLEAGAYAVLVSNSLAYQFRYGEDSPLLGQYEGNLSNAGERLTLTSREGVTIRSFNYGNAGEWPVTADGHGFSLVLKEPETNTDPDRADHWRPGSRRHGTPGESAAPAIPAVWVSEILANSSAPSVDTVELYNPGPNSVDIGGWFLTDDLDTPGKFVFPQGTVIAAEAYLVVEEDNDADPDNNDSLPADFFGKAFALSSNGEEIYLFSADAEGNLTGFADGFTFGATEEGVTLGRETNSIGQINLVAQIRPTFGTTNAGPLSGEVVISEILYHSTRSLPGTTDDDGEFVEIYNRTDEEIPLHDPALPANTWRIAGIDFEFPEGASIGVGQTIIVARVSPEQFRDWYDVPSGATIYGPYSGRLNNDGERLSLEKPGEPYDDDGQERVPMIVVDSVRFNDADPWPKEADGLGHSLERIDVNAYADEPSNWIASATDDGTPGAVDADPPVTNELDYAAWTEEVFTAEEQADANISGPLADPDRDGLANIAEFAFGFRAMDADGPAVTSLNRGEDSIAVTIQRNTLAKDVRITLEVSNDLQVWEPVTAVETGVTNAGGNRETVTLTGSLAGNPGFARLRVE